MPYTKAEALDLYKISLSIGLIIYLYIVIVYYGIKLIIQFGKTYRKNLPVSLFLCQIVTYLRLLCFLL